MSEKEQSSVLVGLLLPYLQKANNPQVGLQNKSMRISFIRKQMECNRVTVAGDRDRHPGHGAEPAATVRAAVRLPAAAQQTLFLYPQQASQKGPYQCLSGTTENETILQIIHTFI